MWNYGRCSWNFFFLDTDGAILCFLNLFFFAHNKTSNLANDETFNYIHFVLSEKEESVTYTYNTIEKLCISIS